MARKLSAHFHSTFGMVSAMTSQATIQLMEECINDWDVSIEDQLHQLAEEVGEIHEAWQTGEEMPEEIGDGEFVLRSIAYLNGEVLDAPSTKQHRDKDTETLMFEMHGQLTNAWKYHERGAELWPCLGGIFDRLALIANREGIDRAEAVKRVTRENAGKSASKKGNKVTKE